MQSKPETDKVKKILFPEGMEQSAGAEEGMDEDAMLEQLAEEFIELFRAGKIPEDLLEREENLVGEAKDSCTLRYEYKTKELLDVEGKVAATVRFGERVRVSGILERVIPKMIPAVLGRGAGALSVLLVCPLPGGEDFRLYVNGGIGDGARFDLKEGGRVHFDLLFGGDVPMPEFGFRKGGDGE